MLDNGSIIKNRMKFTAKAVLRRYQKTDGTSEVCIQAIVNRREAIVGLGFHVKPAQFKNGRIYRHPNSESYNLEVGKAIYKANEIASEFRIADKYLTHTLFIEHFANPINKKDFLAFARKQLELRKPHVDPGTYEQNRYVLDKLTAFRPVILFSELSEELIMKYVDFEQSTYGNSQNTISKALTTWKIYLNIAERNDIKFKNPFLKYKIRTTKPIKNALDQEELARMVKYYLNEHCTGAEKNVLRCFIFSCISGLRISDIIRIKWGDIHRTTLKFMPHKTRRGKKMVEIPLTNEEIKLLPPRRKDTDNIFTTYSEQYMNRTLKEVAKSEACKIKKTVTYHMSRHTFATLFLERGGRVEVLQKLLGHSDIQTTMVYEHSSEKTKRTQKEGAFEGIFDEKEEP